MSELSRFTENILDSLSEGVITVDKNLKINYFNPAAERITGHGRAEVLGKFCKNICASEACHDRCPIAAVLQQGKPLYDFHTTFTHASGKKLPVKLNASIVKNAEGDPIGGTLTFRDLSALEMIHQQLFHESQFFGMVGHNKTMHEIFDLINEIADSPASVLIQGES
ncbi:PAS domain-containing protein, partial [candidate division KSB1 bacterium]|nr:PAS domain-containing protein [candidate division KSB1 bacterium]